MFFVDYPKKAVLKTFILLSEINTGEYFMLQNEHAGEYFMQVKILTFEIFMQVKILTLKIFMQVKILTLEIFMQVKILTLETFMCYRGILSTIEGNTFSTQGEYFTITITHKVDVPTLFHGCSTVVPLYNPPNPPKETHATPGNSFTHQITPLI